MKWLKNLFSKHKVPTKSFAELIKGKQSLFEWIKENTKDGVLQKPLPDRDESRSLLVTSWFNVDMNVDGRCDYMLTNGWDTFSAQKLIDLFNDFAKYGVKNGEVKEEYADKYLGEIYAFTLARRTLEYVARFLELYFKHHRQTNFRYCCFFTAWKFLENGAHREPIKLALAISSIAPQFYGEEEQWCKTFGLSDEFAVSVALALQAKKRNDMIFELAKFVKGYGRIQYLQRLDIENEQMREWILLEGYKCDISINYTAITCMSRGGLLNFIKNRGWSDELYDATGAMLEALTGERVLNDITIYRYRKYRGYNEVLIRQNRNCLVYSIILYKDYQKVFDLFLKQSAVMKMNPKRFAILLSLKSYIMTFIENKNNEEREFAHKNKEAVFDLVHYVSFESGIDWKKIVLDNIFDEDCQIIAKRLNLGIDIWEKYFERALMDENFKDWFQLTLTNEVRRYKILCELAKTRFDLDMIKQGSQEEMNKNLGFIVKGLRKFDRILYESVELVEALLQSPVVGNRNMALKTIEDWERRFDYLPYEIIEIIKINQSQETDKQVLKRYKKLLSKYF